MPMRRITASEDLNVDGFLQMVAFWGTGGVHGGRAQAWWPLASHRHWAEPWRACSRRSWVWELGQQPDAGPWASADETASGSG